MTPAIIGALAVAALLTSMLSAIVGMAGGITLLAVMLLFMDPLLAIPLHGVVQLVSNSTRTVVQRRHVRTDLVARYAILLLPMAYLGLQFAERLDPVALKAFIGVFVLIATWRKEWLLVGTHPENTNPNIRFTVLGGVAGFLNVTVGAVGPFIAPFFLNMNLSRFSLIGTKAACQSLGHLAKIVIFGLAGFAFGPHGTLLVVLCALVVVGTWAGSQLLTRVNEIWFTRLYKGTLTVIAVRLVATPLFS